MRRVKPARATEAKASYPGFERFWTWLRLAPLGLPLLAPDAALADATLPQPRSGTVDPARGRSVEPNAKNGGNQAVKPTPTPRPRQAENFPVHLDGDMPAPVPPAPPKPLAPPPLSTPKPGGVLPLPKPPAAKGKMPVPMRPKPVEREPQIMGLEGRIIPPNATSDDDERVALHLHPHAPDEPCRPARLYTIRFSRS